MAGFGNRARGKASSGIDLGPPRYILRERATRGDDVEWSKTWVWCPRCLARKDHKGRWRGGVLFGRGEQGNLFVVHCECELGERLRAAQERGCEKPLRRPSDYPAGTLSGPPAAVSAADPAIDSVEILGPMGGRPKQESTPTAPPGRKEREP